MRNVSSSAVSKLKFTCILLGFSATTVVTQAPLASAEIRLACCQPILISNSNINGTGKVTLDDGSQYDGEFHKGKFEGEGILIYPDGRRYEGEFQKGKYHGQGTLTSQDGSQYEGGFLKGKYHGQGTLTSPDGARYVGNFLNGQYSGEGNLTDANGTRYEGAFLKGKFHGRGTLAYTDGTRYLGEFANSEFNGNGVFILQDGSNINGTWTNGKRSGYKTPSASAPALNVDRGQTSSTVEEAPQNSLLPSEASTAPVEITPDGSNAEVSPDPFPNLPESGTNIPISNEE